VESGYEKSTRLVSWRPRTKVRWTVKSPHFCETKPTSSLFSIGISRALSLHDGTRQSWNWGGDPALHWSGIWEEYWMAADRLKECQICLGEAQFTAGWAYEGVAIENERSFASKWARAQSIPHLHRACQSADLQPESLHPQRSVSVPSGHSRRRLRHRVEITWAARNTIAMLAHPNRSLSSLPCCGEKGRK